MASRAGHHVEITVTDTGSGIPADRLKAIFDEFVTTKRRGTRPRAGGHQAASSSSSTGTIAVESAVGQGTAFTLRFPAATAVPAARLAAS